MTLPSDLKVLYVEDDPQSRMIMKILLKDALGIADFVVFNDSSEFEAQVQALALEPDVVFLDIHVRPIDGFAMLRSLRAMAKYAKKPIVALTASVMNEEVEQLKTAGFNGVISKPINLDTFPDALQRILSGEEVWNVTH